MARKGLKRLAKIRETLKRQAEIAVGDVQQKINASESALRDLNGHTPQGRGPAGEAMSLALLCETAAKSTDFYLAVLAEEEDRRVKVMHQRVKDARQVERLIERIDEREQQEQAKKERLALEEWTHTRWQRRRRSP